VGKLAVFWKKPWSTVGPMGIGGSVGTVESDVSLIMFHSGSVYTSSRYGQSLRTSSKLPCSTFCMAGRNRMGRVLFCSATPIAVASWNRRLPSPQNRRLAIQELLLLVLLLILILLWRAPLKLRGLGGGTEGPPPPVRTK
jgi:hypothetical protein